ncbi:MAG: hypothetical protein ABSF21_04430 [Dehalococcoidia bacterium]
MSRGRPRGSKSQSTNAYVKRTRRLKRRYGKDIFKKWGKKGGNPILLKTRKKKAKK